jgi:glycosyltransferase involved in cell wall biosynthesis
VVRETVGRWGASHSILLVAWTENGKALRRLDSIEEKRIRGGAKEESRSETPDFEFSRVIVPHGGLLINPELALDAQRAPRLLALARFSDVKTAYIGYDCVPLTSGETASDGVAREFPLYLDAMGDADRLAAISASTELEFRAWKRMLAASGRTGPDVRTFFLGGDSEHPSDAVIESTAEELLVSEAEPLILVVGSHEPRKNHLSVLQAARLLWEQGERFRLVFIGSGSWRSESFFQLADVLQARGFPLVTKTGASDEFLSASYRLAAVSIFTSFHEGFGLPIVESLRSGTPVITSNLGSMLEVAAEYGGVITVDPHSDEELEEVLRRVLHEPSLLADKRRELESNDYRSWDDYAAEVWDYFVEGSDTPPSD